MGKRGQQDNNMRWQRHRDGAAKWMYHFYTFQSRDRLRNFQQHKFKFSGTKYTARRQHWQERVADLAGGASDDNSERH